MGLLTNKRILVTGGSSGIGQAIASACAREGGQIAFTYSSNQKGAEEALSLIKSYGCIAHAIKADLSEAKELEQVVNQVLEYFGGLDILVNNAGTLTRHQSFIDVSQSNLDFIYAVNLRAPFILTQHAAKIMMKQGKGGSIINISSISASVISRGLTHYEISKAGLNALTRSTAAELAKYRIRVNAIEPGLVKTKINQPQWEKELATWQDRCGSIPLGRAGQPEDIASMALYLISEQASWITGSIITVDGGAKADFL